MSDPFGKWRESGLGTGGKLGPAGKLPESQWTRAGSNPPSLPLSLHSLGGAFVSQLIHIFLCHLVSTANSPVIL